MADIDAKAKELAELDVNSTLNLARRLRGLAVDCENTDGWEAPASDVYQAAALILSQAETIAELRKALNLIDALDPEQRVYGCSSDALRGLVIQMGQYARTALARAAKEGLDYWIYGQDGQRVPMRCQDTDGMRRFLAWLRQHDRYTVSEPDTCPALRASKEP